MTVSEDAGPQGEGSASALAEALLALQAHDAHTDQLRYQKAHHPVHAALAELLARHRKLAEQSAPLEAQVAVFDERQGALEREITESEGRIATIEGRLRAGSAGSYRDEGAMSEEITSLRKRKSHLEDLELEVMEEREPIDLELASLKREDAAVGEQARRQHAALNAAEAELARLIAEAEEARAPLAARVAPPLLADYERLRAHLNGVGVARVEHGVCSGCNLALSAGELDRVTHAASGSLSHCEQCGRILVP